MTMGNRQSFNEGSSLASCNNCDCVVSARMSNAFRLEKCSYFLLILLTVSLLLPLSLWCWTKAQSESGAGVSSNTRVHHGMTGICSGKLAVHLITISVSQAVFLIQVSEIKK